MDAAQQARSEKKQELLLQLAELMIEEQVEDPPHPVRRTQRRQPPRRLPLESTRLSIPETHHRYRGGCIA